MERHAPPRAPPLGQTDELQSPQAETTYVEFGATRDRTKDRRAVLRAVAVGAPNCRLTASESVVTVAPKRKRNNSPFWRTGCQTQAAAISLLSCPDDHFPHADGTSSGRPGNGLCWCPMRSCAAALTFARSSENARAHTLSKYQRASRWDGRAELSELSNATRSDFPSDRPYMRTGPEGMVEAPLSRTEPHGQTARWSKQVTPLGRRNPRFGTRTLPLARQRLPVVRARHHGYFRSTRLRRRHLRSSPQQAQARRFLHRELDSPIRLARY